MPEFARALRLLLAQPLPDAALGARRDDMIRPNPCPAIWRSEVRTSTVSPDLQPVAQRHHPAVDARADR